MHGKVFAIGLPRTGTTSLDAAFRALGFSSIHFPFSLWKDSNFGMLDKYQAFSDGPIYAMYPDLHRRFPDANFIITTRPLPDWLESMEWLLTNGPFIWAWEPEYDRFHESFFGSSRFDRDLYAAAYNRHHDEVYAWSEKHQIRLLVLDAAKGYGFKEICNFLNLPVPNSPYPRANPARTPSMAVKCVTRVERILPPLGAMARRLISRWDHV